MRDPRASGRGPRRDPDHGASLRLWPFVLSVSFGIVFMAIADLAWLTAIGTTDPWYLSSTSSQMYTTTLTTATLATLILAALATNRLGALESAARSIETQVPESRDPRKALSVEIREPVGPAANRPPKPEELDQILAELERFTEAPGAQVRTGGGMRAVTVPTPPRQEWRALGRTTDLSASRMALRRGRKLVWQTVAGPLVVYLVFLSISGAMLPGSAGFAQTHFQLNTGLILFLGYGWPFLVAWTIAAVVLLHVAVRVDLLLPGPTREPS